jgi:AcrR family transcriptional regulator
VRRYPLADERLAGALTATLSQLAHWCPLFAEVGFLPTLAFPFVKLFRSDSTLAFEVVATLLTNWCGRWFEAFPHPPLNFLAAFERLLEHHDSELAAHVGGWEGGAAAPAWELLASLLTDVLRRDEWLKARARMHSLHCLDLRCTCLARHQCPYQSKTFVVVRAPEKCAA